MQMRQKRKSSSPAKLSKAASAKQSIKPFQSWKFAASHFTQMEVMARTDTQVATVTMVIQDHQARTVLMVTLAAPRATEVPDITAAMAEMVEMAAAEVVAETVAT